MDKEEENNNEDNDSVGRNISHDVLKLDYDDIDEDNHSAGGYIKHEELKLDFDDIDDDNHSAGGSIKHEILKFDIDDQEDEDEPNRGKKKNSVKAKKMERKSEKRETKEKKEKKKREKKEKNVEKKEENDKSSSIKITKQKQLLNNNSSMDINYDYLFKIALIGDSSTGKTSILLRFVDDFFSEDTKSTIGIDFKFVSLELEPNIYGKMQIWDTCGSERFKSLTTSFIKSCKAFILVFDLTRPNTFKNIEQWIKTINENTSPQYMILIGNKNDLVKERQVKKESVINYCKEKLFNYMEISAKSNNNIEKMFKEVAYQLYNLVKKNKTAKTISNSGEFTNIKVKNENNSNQKKGGGCCS
jgi:Ras-related protein Rab-11A